MNSTSNPSGNLNSAGNAPQPNLNSSDPYAVLGLSHGATQRQAKRAYFSLVRTYPPETEPDAFKKIRAAYEKLRTVDVKAETDLFLFQPPDKWTPRKRRKKLDLSFDSADVIAHLQQQGDLGRTDFSEDYRLVRL
ncbi:MAG: DnaJ domain-containing protein [Chloroflexi bacterium]|nr:DnaJ domain-containing protein [Chloroflexota bacterium]